MTDFAFRWHGDASARCVEVAGSWDGWSKRHALQSVDGTAGREHAGAVRIPVDPGAGARFHFKFVVDGSWRVDGGSLVERDGDGHENNVLAVRPEDVKPAGRFRSYEHFRGEPDALEPEGAGVPVARPWHPGLGAVPFGPGARFRVWADPAEVKRAELVLEGPPGAPAAPERRVPLHLSFSGFFEGDGPAAPGDRYRISLDGGGAVPDIASRWQPEGVYGPSAVVGAAGFPWCDALWETPASIEDLACVYELHVGTFTPEGSFTAAAMRLPQLKAAGVDAVQVMPLSEFRGERGWGYSGALPFAPPRCYGPPDAFRSFVDAAHRCGISVLLDVVYNHWGRDGNYFARYFPRHLAAKGAEGTPDVAWGLGANDLASELRFFCIENALHWVHEYHVDGFRLDSAHNLFDPAFERFRARNGRAVEPPRPHFLQELASALQRYRRTARRPLLIAEDERRDAPARLYRPLSAGGFGYDAVCTDDLYHEMMAVLLDPPRPGGGRSVRSLAGGLTRTYDFERACFLPPSLAGHVAHLQTHDAVANLSTGARLASRCSPGAYRAASTLLLSLPHTVMLFMGQEWGARTPFHFFVNYDPDRDAAVNLGRLKEFASVPGFREKVPPPGEERSFSESVLRWPGAGELEEPGGPHALHRALLALRASRAAMRCRLRSHFAAVPVGEGAVAVLRRPLDGGARGTLAFVACFWGAGEYKVDLACTPAPEGRWRSLLPDGESARATCLEGRPRALFSGPGAAAFECLGPGDPA
eukprot:tig00000792_g4202.t1